MLETELDKTTDRFEGAARTLVTLPPSALAEVLQMADAIANVHAERTMAHGARGWRSFCRDEFVRDNEYAGFRHEHLDEAADFVKIAFQEALESLGIRQHPFIIASDRNDCTCGRSDYRDGHTCRMVAIALHRCDTGMFWTFPMPFTDPGWIPDLAIAFWKLLQDAESIMEQDDGKTQEDHA